MYGCYIIEGDGYDVCLYINARGVRISGFVVQNGERCIWLEDSTACIITNNTVFNNRGQGGPNRIVHEGHGIALFQACNNVISGNKCKREQM
jgi:parallel beta-helix repeat protein